MGACASKKTSLPTLSPECEAKVKESFEKVDTDKSGTIEVDEAKTKFSSFGAVVGEGSFRRGLGECLNRSLNIVCGFVGLVFKSVIVFLQQSFTLILLHPRPPVAF